MFCDFFFLQIIFILLVSRSVTKISPPQLMPTWDLPFSPHLHICKLCLPKMKIYQTGSFSLLLQSIFVKTFSLHLHPLTKWSVSYGKGGVIRINLNPSIITPLLPYYFICFSFFTFVLLLLCFFSLINILKAKFISLERKWCLPIPARITERRKLYFSSIFVKKQFIS